jgi:hypothetical protein
VAGSGLTAGKCLNDLASSIQNPEELTTTIVEPFSEKQAAIQVLPIHAEIEQYGAAV